MKSLEASVCAGLLLVSMACSDPGSPRLSGSVSSLDVLGEAVVTALAARDTAALQRLRLTEREHNELVWPELPASSPTANFPVDYAWNNIQIRNKAALLRLLSYYGGRELKHEGTECRGPTQEFADFVVLTDCWVRLRVDGRAEVVGLFKDVLVWAGKHKIFRYYHDRRE